ncbi:MAG TPA: gluconate:H+ symporter [Chitinophagaceae bacterium]|nr:gluconate:H+ symporter [Chitinophagaceae bacterium]
MPILLCLLSIILLVVLIVWVKLDTFISFVLVSILLGLAGGMSVNELSDSMEKGIGNMMGTLVIILGFGAMLGKLVAESGAAQQITNSLTSLFGRKYMRWGLSLAGLIVGIPLFYTAGFVVVIPLIFAVGYSTKLPLLSVGVPMLAALSVAHGFLPPHPSPTAIAQQLHADIGKTLLLGLLLAIPAITIAGPLFGSTLKKYNPKPPVGLLPDDPMPVEELPGIGVSLFAALLPLVLLAITTIAGDLFPQGSFLDKVVTFIGNPNIAMFLSVLVAIYLLGIRCGRKIPKIMIELQDAFKGVSVILLILAGSGVFMEVMKDSGVNTYIALALKDWHIQPLILGWMIAAIIRVCIGSATVAGLTTVGIILPLVSQQMVHPSLMVLAIGAGSLMFSHVNDGGFWLFKEYFNLSIKETFKTWTAMETIVSVTGLAGVLVLNVFL